MPAIHPEIIDLSPDPTTVEVRVVPHAQDLGAIAVGQSVN